MFADSVTIYWYSIDVGSIMLLKLGKLIDSSKHKQTRNFTSQSTKCVNEINVGFMCSKVIQYSVRLMNDSL